MIGGMRHQVQIDEMKYGHWKYYRVGFIEYMKI